MDTLNSCDWSGRVEGGIKSCGETGSCFWCNDGLAIEMVIGCVQYLISLMVTLI